MTCFVNPKYLLVWVFTLPSDLPPKSRTIQFFCSTIKPSEENTAARFHTKGIFLQRYFYNSIPSANYYFFPIFCLIDYCKNRHSLTSLSSTNALYDTDRLPLLIQQSEHIHIPVWQSRLLHSSTIACSSV